jgi:hypothetical protein
MTESVSQALGFGSELTQPIAREDYISFSLLYYRVYVCHGDYITGFGLTTGFIRF